MATGRTPDYRTSVLNKDTDKSNGDVGGAWKNENGSISIQLKPFVVLDNRDGNLVLTLFPVEAKVRKPKRERAEDFIPTADRPFP